MMKRRHKGVDLSSASWEYQILSELTNTIKSQVWYEWYSCSQFAYLANNNFVLKKHGQCIHNNAGYSCDQCKYQVTHDGSEET